MTSAPILDPAQIRAFVQAERSDLFLINGGIERGLDVRVIHEIHKRQKKAENATLVLVTFGGNADAAYRIARCLQENYKKVTCIISGFCKSAGTIVATGAHELVFGPAGELGPIDVQMGKKDEYGSSESGLTVMTALQSLNSQVTSELVSRLQELRKKGVPSKIAESIACTTIANTYSGIFSQINPNWVGEAGRGLNVAHNYGRRLGAVSGNLRPDALNELVGNYPDHGFVIDFKEARTLFHQVRDYQGLEVTIVNELAEWAVFPLSEGGAGFYMLSSDEDVAASNDQGHNTSGEQGIVRGAKSNAG